MTGWENGGNDKMLTITGPTHMVIVHCHIDSSRGTQLSSYVGMLIIQYLCDICAS